MELSIVIVSYNVCELLKQCIDSVVRAAGKIECEIFVVDNNSSDNSCLMIEQEYPRVILIKNSFNSGFSAANNQAIRLAEGHYILLLNPDTVIKNDTLLKSISFMDNHPDAGMMGVRMINGDGRFLPESKRALPTPATAFFKIFGFAFLFPRSRVLNRYYHSDIDNFKTGPAEIISGAFMFIRKEALSKTGLLDEDFFMYGEDIDLSYRMLQTGYNNYYYPEIEIVHYKGKSTPRDNYSDIVHFYGAMRVYVRKRVQEGKLTFWRFIIIPAVYMREGLALLMRALRIRFHN
jgi:GT2 family glycosyltransferase